MVLNRLTGFLPGVSGPDNPLIKEIKDLQRSYDKRTQAFNDWYKLLSLEDELAQPNMESFVGNDPRTTWNMATFLLQPKPFVHKVVTTDGTVLPDSTQEFVQFVQQYFSRLWLQINQSDMKRGRSSWFWSFIGLLVGTGWYALPHFMTPEGKPVVDYWNPSTVFPDFSDNIDEGLVRLARVRTVSSALAQSIIAREGWGNPRSQLPSRTVEGQLWKKLPDGTVVHGATMGNSIVKPLTPMPGVSEIPILTGSAAGIPLFTDDTKANEYALQGQSILATNAPVYRNYNKQQSFIQQLIRDGANPKYKQRSMGNKSIVASPDELYRRGALFELGPNGELDVVQQPGIPAELTQSLFTLRNQIQRGSFSDLTFGNVLGDVTALIIAQAAEAALQLITPFYNVITFSVSEVTNGWYQLYLAHPELRPQSWPDIPEDLINTRITSTYTIKIPGDLTNRVNIAKMLNPRFELPIDYLLELLMPEVQNTQEAMAKLEAERSRMHPSYVAVQLIQAFERLAEQARNVRNMDQAQLFQSLADNMKKQITGAPTTDERLGTAGARSEAESVIPNIAEQRLGNNGNNRP